MSFSFPKHWSASAKLDVPRNHIPPEQMFCVGGRWLAWIEMTPSQRSAKIESKIRISEATNNEAELKFWENAV